MAQLMSHIIPNCTVTVLPTTRYGSSTIPSKVSVVTRTLNGPQALVTRKVLAKCTGPSSTLPSAVKAAVHGGLSDSILLDSEG